MDDRGIFINHEKGTVVIKMRWHDFEDKVFEVALEKLLREFRHHRVSAAYCAGGSVLRVYLADYFYGWIREKNYGENIITRAKCNFSKGDKFSEDIGFFIAQDRMDAKISAVEFEFLCDFFDDMNAFLVKVTKKAESLGTFTLKTLAHIKELGESDE